MELTYLASPYTHHDKDVIESRYLQAVAAVRALMAQGEHVFSPIVHCHIVAKNSSLPLDWDYWRDIDFDFIDRCDKMTVLMIEGWEDSKGVQAEIKYATEMSMVIEYIKLTQYTLANEQLDKAEIKFNEIENAYQIKKTQEIRDKIKKYA